MPMRIRELLGRLSLLQRFLLVSLAILVGGTVGLGEYIGRQIEQGVVHRTAATTASFVDSFIAPSLQELAEGDALSENQSKTLTRLLEETPLGKEVVAFKVWGPGGRIVFSNEASSIGQVFPVTPGQASAWGGEVSADISSLQNAENVLERAQQSELLEVYSPVRQTGTQRVIAVAEFYQSVNDLNRELAAARQRTWVIVGSAMLVIYLLLAGFVRGASNTIDRQQAVLSRQVAQLTELLAQNESLHDRIRSAAARFTALNERILRRFSAELHDGAAQDLSLALLRLDHVSARHSSEAGSGAVNDETKADIDVIQGSVQRALEEIRALSAGLGVPQLNALSLPETLARVIRGHEQRTGTRVTADLGELPAEVPLPLKITIYRLIQEALNNAFRHGGGADQRVEAAWQGSQIHVEVCDAGPGFSPEEAHWWDDHLGLVGMRERVESLGGTFRVESAPGKGTRIVADLPFRGAGAHDG